MLEVALIIVIAILAVLVSVVIIRRGTDRSGKPVENTELPDIQLDLKLQEELRSLASRGHTEHAIRRLRKQTRLSPHEATLVVQALMVGRAFPAAEHTSKTETRPNAVIDDDLLNKLRTLVKQDPHKRTAAIRLLRDRTGMNAKDARRFVNAL